LLRVEAFPWPKTEDYQLDLLYEIDRQLPQGMKVIVSGGFVFAEAWMLMGFSNFAEATLLTPEIPIAIMNRLGKFRYESFLRVMELKNLGALWFDDDIAYGTGTMVSPTFLRENLFPWIGKIGQLCKEKGIPFIYHTDGNVTAVLEDIHQSGVNALHPIQPGAMDAVSLKKDWGDRLALVGGMELDIITRGGQEDIEDLVRRQLTELKPGGGYAPGTSNTVPAWMPVENYLWFRDCCIKYGVY
jgi:uroporphyrinogen decarboxylase